MKVATWNVNSIRARLDNVVSWLESAQPDVALLQEIKAQDDTFPFDALKDIGYHAHIVGQKSYNGVAVLSKEPVEVIHRALPGDESDEQARYLEVQIGKLTIACLYLPNGNPIDTEKFPYKISWMERLEARAKELLAEERPFLMAGDYNVCPTEKDLWDAKRLANDALTQPESRDAWFRLVNLGLTDAFRMFDSRESQYSYWDYTQGAFDKDWGLRIDHFLLSPEVADRTLACEIDRAPRGKEKASDHTPVVLSLTEDVTQ